MSNIVSCPHCKNEFPIDQVMQAQLSASIRAELENEFSRKTNKLVAEKDALALAKRELEAKQEQFDQQVHAAIAEQREKIETQARVTAQQAVAVEIKDRDKRLKENETKIQEYVQKELELRSKARQLEEQAQQQELEIARRIDEERKKVRSDALREAQEQNALKQAEEKLINESLRKQVEELKQKLEQGSQQTQGEVLEIALEELLAREFPGDVIEPVAKGARGGDVIHHVFDHAGRECGVILWETKRTKNWSDKWLSKAIDDQQEAKASCACIVSAALPEDIQHFGDLNGVWVASWSCARSAAFALRTVLVEASRARVAAEGQHGKAESVYQYVFGPEFRNRIRGLIEPHIEMQNDLESEKRAINRHWNKRQKQLDRALASTTGLFGDLQGIIGNGLQEIEGMDLLAIGTEEKQQQTFSTESS